MLGFTVVSAMKKRVFELQEIERVIGYIEGELRYNHALLYEAVMKCSQKADKCLKPWLDNLCKSLTALSANDLSVNEIWQRELSYLLEDTYLMESDIELLKNFGQAFGYLDVCAQENAIKLEKDRYHQELVCLSGKLKEKTKLVLYMSVLSGLGLVIILL